MIEMIKSDIVVIISFICNVISVILWFLPKSFKESIINQIHTKNLKSIVIILIYLITGLVAPVFILIKSFSDWSGWAFWLSQVLCWYSLLYFIFLIYIILTFNKLIK